MHSMRILNSKETKKIRQQLELQWGEIPKIDLAFLRSPKGKLYVVSKDIAKLPDEKIRIDTLGMYFGELMVGDYIRLSVEGAQIVGKHATKNILEIEDSDMEQWLKGKDLACDEKLHGFFILKSKTTQDILGCGHAKKGRIANYVPKNRRVNEVNPTYE